MLPPKVGTPLRPLVVPAEGTWAVRSQGPRPSFSTGPSSVPEDSLGASSWQTTASQAPPPLGAAPDLCDPLKLRHAVVTIVDVDVDLAEKTCDEVAEDDPIRCGVERQRTLFMGAESFYEVFHDRHPDGHAPLEELHDLLDAAGVVASAEQVEAAVLKCCAECKATGRITATQGQEVFVYLNADQPRTAQFAPELAAANRFMRWLVNLSDKQATDLLQVVVFIFCCVSAFLAAGLSILFMMQDGDTNFRAYMQEDLHLVQDSLEQYVSTGFVPQQLARPQLFLTVLSTTFRAAFLGQVQQTGDQLLKAVVSLSASIGAWWHADPTQPYTDAALVLALLADAALADLGGRPATTGLFDDLNSDMPAGSEVLLGHWQNDTAAGTVEYLTTLRYAAQCPSQGCISSPAATAPMRAALLGNSSAQRALDYRNVSVFVGYSGHDGMGVELKTDRRVLDDRKLAGLKAFLDGWNAVAPNTYEFLLAYSPSPGSIVPVTTLMNCSASCAKRAVAAGSPLARAVAGQSGVLETTSARGVPVVAAFVPVGVLGAGLALQVSKTELAANAVADMALVVDALNRGTPPGGDEFEFATFAVRNGSLVFTHLTAYQFAAECPASGCVAGTEYMRQAALNCSAIGVLSTADYRGKAVLAAYSCIPELNAVLSMKTDTSKLTNDVLQIMIQAINTRIDLDTDTSAEYLMATPNPGLTAAQVNSYADFRLATKIKYPEQCLRPNCTWNRTSALLALQDRQAVVDCHDYRDKPVTAAPTRSYAIPSGVGIALELDSIEVMQPIIDTAIAVSGFAIGLVMGSTLLLVCIAKFFLKSMITAKEEGKKAVEVEKDRFSKVVASMYPTYVLPRLLAGEKQMVCEVPAAAVFFSDIHEFTSASNTMGSQVLLQLLGYVYGVMDDIADRYGVYKVKTIGDAYLAVNGLPGSDSANPSLDLLRFASCVAQVFSPQYLHPPEGDVLVLMNKAMAWNRPAFVRQATERSLSPNSTAQGPLGAPLEEAVTASLPGSVRPKHSRASSVSTTLSRLTEAKVQCVMSYGLATGRLVAGVLAGRCPMFDIWGGTVNLASRMQSTGEPGRIQVSEQLYRKVVAVEGQPFAFDAPRNTYCKGFGTVQAYLVRTTTEGLPADLEGLLRLEPRYGPFRFDTVVTSASKDATAATQSTKVRQVSVDAEVVVRDL